MSFLSAICKLILIFRVTWAFGDSFESKGRIDLKRAKYLSALQDTCNETRKIEDDDLIYLLSINGKAHKHGPIHLHEDHRTQPGYTINTDFTDTPRKNNKKTAIQAEFQKPHHVHVVRFDTAEGYEHDLFTMAWYNPDVHQWHAIIHDGKVKTFTYGQSAVVGKWTRVLRFYPEDWKGKDAWLPQPTYIECVGIH
ncbi:hypothetical protein CAPTEDRAFT_192435 [Capitella teleta]|uniref:Farnesoic acid O-methyl transferase domain-containing protein n=1 Tax=Capitella teleta TaxID=283909 RepID=R7VJZ1_CAPTE|nr:hypothetical protein CAPTEDRAFT_192435 [Capitella teleta]|eukprot:ELU16325.1 hypothetical protein CAPTEDRAFT_192435 [Capitella teleta]